MSRYQFPKGNRFSVGNSGGAKAKVLTQRLISQLNEIMKMKVKEPDGTEKLVDKEKLDWIVNALIMNAIGGDTEAIKYIFDRVEGKLMQPLGGGEDGKLPLVVGVIERIIVPSGQVLERPPGGAPVVIEHQPANT